MSRWLLCCFCSMHNERISKWFPYNDWGIQNEIWTTLNFVNLERLQIIDDKSVNNNNIFGMLNKNITVIIITRLTYNLKKL